MHLSYLYDISVQAAKTIGIAYVWRVVSGIHCYKRFSINQARSLHFHNFKLL